MPKPKKPKRIPKWHRANFNTRLKAIEYGDVALVSAIRKADKENVCLICAMQSNDDGTITPVPLAVMIERNPYELFEDPTIL